MLIHSIFKEVNTANDMETHETIYPHRNHCNRHFIIKESRGKQGGGDNK